MNSQILKALRNPTTNLVLDGWMIRQFGLPRWIRIDNLIPAQQAFLMAITAVAPSTESLQLRYLYDMQAEEIEEKDWLAEVEKAEVTQQSDLLASIAAGKGITPDELMDQKAEEMKQAALKDLRGHFPTLFSEDNEIVEERKQIQERAERIAAQSERNSGYRRKFAELLKEKDDG